jgi:hypothetical protein
MSLALPNEPRPGDKIKASVIAQLIRYCRSITGKESPDILPQQGMGGTTYVLKRAGNQQQAADTETPFQVVSRVNGSTLELGVISNSHLFNSESRNDYEEDNSDWGLLDDDRTTGWFTAPDIGKKIWLKITLDPDDQSITAIDVESGDAWDGYPDPININTDDPDNPFQEFFYQIIAEITDPEQDPRPGLILNVPGGGDDQIQVTQLLYANLMMTTAHTSNDADEPGLPLLVAIPWSVLPGTATDGSADQIPPEDDLMTPWQLGDQETLNDYNFELFNASEPGAPKVLVLDGVVIGPNGDPVDPDGMPSDDTFTLDVADGDEIWLEINWSTESDDGVSGEDIDSVSIANGASTPDDSFPTTYVTIGSVSVDDSGDVPIVTCRNELCGDLLFWIPPNADPDGSNDFALVVDKDTGNRVWKKVCDTPCP